MERLRKTGRDARLEDTVSRRVSEDEFYDFSQPDEVLRFENLVPAPFIQTPEQGFESRELQPYITQTLAQRPKRWRLAFVLHHGEGCSIAVTAHLLEMTERDTAEARERACVFLSQKLAKVRLAVPAQRQTGIMRTRMVPCSRTVTLLTAYPFDLPAGQTDRKVRRHQRACPRCASWVRSMRAAMAFFGTAPTIEAPASVRRQVEAVLGGTSGSMVSRRET